MVNDFLNIIGLFVGGGAGVLLYNLFQNGSARKTNEYIKTINLYRVDIEALKNEVHNLTKELMVLKEALVRKDLMIALLEAQSFEAPFPFWLKSVEGKILYVNKAYELAFGIDADDYIGHKDNDVWDDTSVFRYTKWDEIAMSSGLPFVVTSEEVEGYITIKWRRMVGNTALGVAGMCIPAVDYYGKKFG